MILYLAQLLQQAVVVVELQKLMMLDQEVRAVVLVGQTQEITLVVLVIHPQHLLMVETAHHQHQDKEIMEEIVLLKHQFQQAAVVVLAV
jgi:hypothetical protein